jgi:hypothetical protein
MNSPGEIGNLGYSFAIKHEAGPYEHNLQSLGLPKMLIVEEAS